MLDRYYRGTKEPIGRHIHYNPESFVKEIDENTGDDSRPQPRFSQNGNPPINRVISCDISHEAMNNEIWIKFFQEGF